MYSKRLYMFDFYSFCLLEIIPASQMHMFKGKVGTIVKFLQNKNFCFENLNIFNNEFSINEHIKELHKSKNIQKLIIYKTNCKL